jgi:CheY-like chemotaxis protein
MSPRLEERSRRSSPSSAIVCGRLRMASLRLSRWQELPDILLSDLNMPGISGVELLSAVREWFPAIRVIAMSGDFSGVGMPPRVCADAFYEKGSRLAYLLQVVETMASAECPSFLQRPSAPAPTWIPGNGHASCREADQAICQPIQPAVRAHVHATSVPELDS